MQCPPAAEKRMSWGSSAPAVWLYGFVPIAPHRLPKLIWVGVPSLIQDKGWTALSTIFGKVHLTHTQTTKLKPEVPTSPRAGASAFLLQQHICTGSKTAADTILLPASPARPALGISAQTPDPAPAPCFCTHSRPGCNTIIDSSTTGLSYSSRHGDCHRSLPQHLPIALLPSVQKGVGHAQLPPLGLISPFPCAPDWLSILLALSHQPALALTSPVHAPEVHIVILKYLREVHGREYYRYQDFS